MFYYKLYHDYTALTLNCLLNANVFKTRMTWHKEDDEFILISELSVEEYLEIQ